MKIEIHTGTHTHTHATHTQTIFLGDAPHKDVLIEEKTDSFEFTMSYNNITTSPYTKQTTA